MSGLIGGGNVSLKLSTRSQREIENTLCRDALTAGDRRQVADLKSKYLSALYKPGTLTQSYNCHGLTFACRRASVTNTATLEHILRDDDYAEISPKDVLPGDIAIYRAPPEAGGEIEHSGIVVEPPNGQGGLLGVPKLVSKWGKMDEAIHLANYGPYSQYKITYHRVTK